jgi:hypothetical protein
MGDVMPCDRERERDTPQSKIWCYYPFWKNYLPHNSFILQTLISSSCMFSRWTKKKSPPSTNTSKNCRDLFPYFPSLQSRLADEHTVTPNKPTPRHNPEDQHRHIHRRKNLRFRKRMVVTPWKTSVILHVAGSVHFTHIIYIPNVLKAFLGITSLRKST